MELAPFVETVREKLVFQEKFLLKEAKLLTSALRGKKDKKTRALVTKLKRKANSIRREIARTIQNLPAVVLQACPSACESSFTVSFELAEEIKVSRLAKEFLNLAKLAISERYQVGRMSPCSAACRERVRQRRLQAQREIEKAREISVETVRVIKGTPRINSF